MNNRTVLISFAVALLVLYVLMFVMLIVVMNRTASHPISLKKGAEGEAPEGLNGIDKPLAISSLTDFFNRSLHHAQKVLYGNEPFTPVPGNSQSWLVALALKMNTDTKAQIGKALQYGLTDPAIARADEARLRALAIQQNVPLWFTILADAVNKVVPAQLSGTLSLPPNYAVKNNTATTTQAPKPVTTNKKRKKANSGPKVIQLHATG